VDLAVLAALLQNELRSLGAAPNANNVANKRQGRTLRTVIMDEPGAVVVPKLEDHADLSCRMRTCGGHSKAVLSSGCSG
jgi:hypothetical protein